MSKLLLTPAEVAEKLGVPRPRVYAMLGAKRLPAIRFGRRIRIPAIAVEQWIEEQLATISVGGIPADPRVSALVGGGNETSAEGTER